MPWPVPDRRTAISAAPDSQMTIVVRLATTTLRARTLCQRAAAGRFLACSALGNGRSLAAMIGTCPLVSSRHEVGNAVEVAAYVRRRIVDEAAAAAQVEVIRVGRGATQGFRENRGRG